MNSYYPGVCRKRAFALSSLILGLSLLASSAPARSQAQGAQTQAPDRSATPAPPVPTQNPTANPNPARTPQGRTSTSGISSTPALAPVPDLRVSLDPVSTTIGYGENTAKLSFRLTNFSDEERAFRVEVGPLTLRNAEATARVSLPGFAGADWAEVAVPPRGTTPLAVNVEGLSHLGSYEGNVRVRPVQPSTTETVFPLKVVRQSPGFDLVFKGDGVSNNVFTMKPKSEDDKSFSFVVENPKTASDALVDVKMVANFTGKSEPIALTIAPATAFSLKPGATQTVELTANKLPASGDFAGRLSFQDRGGATRDLELRLQPSFVPLWDWAAIIALVLAGALLSAIVGAAIPNLMQRNRLRNRFNAIRETLSALPGTEEYAKAVVFRQLHRISGEALDIGWYTPSASDTLAGHEKSATELDERVKLLASVAEQRLELRTSVDIPSSARTRLNRELDGVAVAIAKATVADAKERLAALVQSVKAAQEVEVIRKALDATFSMLPPSAPAGSHDIMRDRLRALHETYAALSPSSPSEVLLEVDYQAQCADLYFNRFRKDVISNRPGDDDFVKAETDVIDALRRGKPELMDAALLVESLQRGVTKAALDDALKNLPANAYVEIIPAEPQVGELVNFRLVFNNDPLNSAPLLKDVTVRWTFDRGVSEANGVKAGQYFRKTFRSYFGKTVNYTVRVGPGSNHGIVGTLKLRGQSVVNEVIGKAEVVSFLVTLLGSVGLAVLSKQAEMRPLESAQDYINPFLWGFGLDRMKSLVNARAAPTGGQTN